MAKQSQLSNEARALAQAIRAIRPRVYDGSNVIIVEADRKRYYDLTTAAALVLWPPHKSEDKRASAEFFDLCGIPD